MAFSDRGLTYRASARAYIGNYLMAVGTIILGFLIINKFDLVFTLSPAGIFEILGTIAYVLVGGIAAYLFVEFFLEGMMRRYIVLDHEIIMIEGIFSRKRESIPYQSIAEIKVVRGPIGRLFNYGRIDVIAFGEGGLSMKHMTNPEEIQRIIQHKVNSVRRVTVSKKKGVKITEEEDNFEE
jgi:uncharacterized membrane protein YdbT with pleckstrin-like domain